MAIFTSFHFRTSIITALALCFFIACNPKETKKVERPQDIWAFRSVLDKKPRMLTLALGPEFFVSYDLAKCTLYKTWKGGVQLEGAPYTSKKNVQPTSWGKAYFQDSLQNQKWVVALKGKEISSRITSRGYAFEKNQIYLKYALILSSGDSIFVEERPEFLQSESKQPGLERWYRTYNVPEGMSISLQNESETIQLNSNDITVKTDCFEPLPEQFPPKLEDAYDHRGRYWMEESDCFTCHEIEENTIGPSLREIASRYPNNSESVRWLAAKIKSGGFGSWGTSAMSAHPKLSDNELGAMLEYIFTLKSKHEKSSFEIIAAEDTKTKKEKVRPGFGAPLEDVHPSYDLATLDSQGFQPKVGGLAFLPDGRLLLTTWDTEGAVYILNGIQGDDNTKITKRRIASGLHEPLGIEVVDGNIYVLQKQELTQLIDHNGDEIIDEYKPVCNSWQVTDDFHEFAFGLVYDQGYFYISLSMAMRLLSGQNQKADRGKTLRIAPDGSYETLNLGLRTPNGIGLGVDRELFVTDNQGQWLPANKLIHVKKGEYHGMGWTFFDTHTVPPKMTPPTLWLPQDEIGNSPSEPILMRDGPYKGQMLHGDVSHGGLKRDFLEKIGGRYQGVVFRFTQGLKAGVNRICYGPDGALYLGEVGMGGGWSWKDNMFGLQRLKYNGKPTFEMLAIRARPKGFEIEFTHPVANMTDIKLSDFRLDQWHYLPTADYGGPKLDLQRLHPSRMELSTDSRRIYLEVPELKKEHVVYFNIPKNLQSSDGHSLWSSEAWYTLNTIPRE